MIEMPSRSITRFFVPMIDVLTLLFCIYLLMPIVSDSEGESEASRLQRERALQELEAERAKQGGAGKDISEELLAEIKKLRLEKAQALKNRLSVRVLEIDPLTGQLYERDPERVAIKDQSQAQKMIERDRRERGLGDRELYYLVLYPRDPNSPYPTRGQRRQYERWFQGVALGFDIPSGAGKGEAGTT